MMGEPSKLEATIKAITAIIPDAAAVIDFAKRWVKTPTASADGAGWSHPDVPRPNSVSQYAAYMGGVDRHDQLRAAYSTFRRSKRYYFPLFYFVLDAAIVNAYIVHESISKRAGATPFKQRAFREAIYRELVALEDDDLTSARTITMLPVGDGLPVRPPPFTTAPRRPGAAPRVGVVQPRPPSAGDAGAGAGGGTGAGAGAGAGPGITVLPSCSQPKDRHRVLSKSVASPAPRGGRDPIVLQSPSHSPGKARPAGVPPEDRVNLHVPVVPSMPSRESRPRGTCGFVDPETRTPCTRKARYYCVACGTFLCISDNPTKNCFARYHSLGKSISLQLRPST